MARRLAILIPNRGASRCYRYRPRAQSGNRVTGETGASAPLISPPRSTTDIVREWCQVQ